MDDAEKTPRENKPPQDFDPEHPERFEEDKPLDRGVIIGMGGRWLSDWALRLAIIAIAAFLLWKGLGFLWVGILPVLLALILATVLWPPVRMMIKWKFPAALAALLSIVVGLGLIAGIIALITPSIVKQFPQLVDSASIGIRQLQDWVQGPPINLQDEQMNAAVDKAVAFMQQRGEEIATSVFSGVSTVGSFVVTLVMVVVLTFFFIKDGPRFLPWLRGVTGRRTGRHLTEVLTRSWVTLGGFIRTQALVSLVDAVFIGLGLVILGVPLAWALAIITFLGGFIPIVGAFTAGALAVLIAFVSNGLTTAIIVLIIIIAVQQLEGNVLQPVLQSRSMNLHPVVILLSVAAGGTLFGILGAFLAVPVAAVVAVVLRYVSEQVDLLSGDVAANDVNVATEEGRLTAWLAEVASVRFRGRSGMTPQDRNSRDSHTGEVQEKEVRALKDIEPPGEVDTRSDFGISSEAKAAAAEKADRVVDSLPAGEAADSEKEKDGGEGNSEAGSGIAGKLGAIGRAFRKDR
ncbi:AI-2E family transporter [Dietzia sp.]|uniref:AI-2E family transporter n=1 Tax=Dietzia sp. TaxID=1871616 RepID=UPI002FDB15E2